jgi:hypothetical protein
MRREWRRSCDQLIDSAHCEARVGGEFPEELGDVIGFVGREAPSGADPGGRDAKRNALAMAGDGHDALSVKLDAKGCQAGSHTIVPDSADRTPERRKL